MAIPVLLSFIGCNAQIKNAKTESVKIFGNCGMCQTTIQKAGNLTKVAKVDWNKDSKMATITYDSVQTSQDEILKRIALSGYDNEKYLAPNDVYVKLPECCQYERSAQNKVKTNTISSTNSSKVETQNNNLVEMKSVFDNYFEVKDALVKTDGNTVASKAKELLTAISAIKMDELANEEHTIWMKVMKNLVSDASRIADTRDVSIQRKHFITLSKNIYDLIKVSKTETPVYFQFCPMANDGKGANWLSKENEVKNPYYGSQMLTCGKTVETIK